MEGYVNVDRMSGSGVDVVADLDQCAATPLPFDDDTIAEIVGIDLIEHIVNPLPLMQELWRIAKPDATCMFELPYGSSDDAWEDPTHVRPYFLDSWMYFAAPTYYRANYGYCGDWQPEQIDLNVDCPGTRDEIFAHVMAFRNVVSRQRVWLRAVKPCRPPDPRLMQSHRLVFKQTGR